MIHGSLSGTAGLLPTGSSFTVYLKHAPGRWLPRVGQTNCLPFAAGTHCGRSKNSTGLGVLLQSEGLVGVGNSKRMPPDGNR